MSRPPETRPGLRLARRAASFASSPWSEIDQYLDAHPDLIYFGSGAPATELYPIERLSWASDAAWEEMPLAALDYGELSGYGPLRELITERMAAQGIQASADSVAVMSGSQQGLDFVAKLFLDPGDALVVEAPTYIGALQAFDAYEPDYWAIPMDDEGLSVVALRARIERTGIVPKLAYVIPTYQNPTGITMSPARRTELIELARHYGMAIVEDDPYSEMTYDGPPPPALRAMDDRVIYLGTFSKSIAPGLRVGWVVAPPELYGQLLMAKEAADIHPSRPVMRTVHRAATGFLDGHVVEAQALYRRRRDTLMAALEREMPSSVTWARPGGGFFTWLSLPNGLTGAELLPVAARHGAGFLPGRHFYPRADAEDCCLRLSFSSLPEERLETGAARLGAALRELVG